jgi:hypothetical protein
VECLDFHGSLFINISSLYSLDDEKRCTKPKKFTSVYDYAFVLPFCQVHLFSIRDLLCFPAAKIRDDVVLRRSSNTLIGLVGSIIVLVNWASTPAGKPVTGGLYRYSRHPMYVTEVLLLLCVSIILASWVFLLFPIIIGVGAVHFIKMEEAQTLGHYGAAYREYMNRTPKWIGIPKPKKTD